MRFSLLLFLLISPLFLFAQNYTIHKEYISTKKGLSNNFVNDIIQDSQGFIWIATQDGLNRYDGYTFEHFRVSSKNPNGLSNNIIGCLTEDKQGNIWIVTFTGVAKWERATGKIQNIPIHIDGRKIDFTYPSPRIVCDYLGNIWICNGYALLMYDVSTKKWQVSAEREQSAILSEGGVLHIEEQEIKGKKEILMVKVFPNLHHVLYMLDRQKNEWIRILDTYLNNIKYVSKNGTIFLFHSGSNKDYMTQSKLYHEGFSLVNIEYNDSFSGNYYTLNYNEIGADVFLIETAGIVKLNLQTQKVEKFWSHQLFANEISDGAIEKVFVDKSKNLWVYGNGIALLPFKNLENPKTYHTSIPDKFRFKANSIRSIYQDKYGRVWTSGYAKSNTIFILDENGEHKELVLEGDIDVVYQMTTDPQDDNYVYVASDNLRKIDIRTLEVVKKYDTKGVRISGFIFLDKEEIMFTETLPHSFAILNLRTEKIRKVLSEGCTCLYQDSQNHIWVGLAEKGLGLLSEDMKTIQPFVPNKNKTNNISSNHVFTIYEDSKQRFWLGTRLGLNLMNRETGTFTHFTEEDGLANNTVYSILEDKKGNLWLSTNQGISKFNPETKQFTNFDVSEGLQDNEFNTNAFFKNEKTGEMFFGGIGGLNSFEPEKMTKNTYVPPIILTAFKRKDETVDLGRPLNEVKQIEMNYDEAQTLSFEFVALNYFQSYKNRYAYKIEEIHEDWISLDTKHELTLTNLNAGTYTIRIKGSNNDGVWNEKGLNIILIVKPPFWQTWWFLGLLILFFMGIVYTLFRIRTYQLRKRKVFLEEQVEMRTEEIQTQAENLEKQAGELQELNQTKDRLFSIIAHDLRSPMTAFESITQQLDFYIEHNELERVKVLNQHIKTSSYNVNTLLNNLLSWALMQKKLISLQPKLLQLEDVIQDVLKNFEMSLENYQIQLSLRIKPHMKIYADENALNAILRNLISNAIKFTPKQGAININAYPETHYDIIEIQDSGMGIDAEKMPHLFNGQSINKSKGLRGEKGTGLGLVLVGEFMEMHQGEIEVFSQENEGTTIALKFPKQ